MATIVQGDGKLRRRPARAKATNDMGEEKNVWCELSQT
jgi:hypothetical protein